MSDSERLEKQKEIFNRNFGYNYDIIMKRVEADLLEFAMMQTQYNQSKAAKSLGISRGSLRSKLKEYFGNQYIGGV